MPGTHPHGTTAYAAPVTFRAPSPASSIGTLYDDDATSDQEANMGALEFAKFCEEKMKINQPRPEEERAMMDPLVRDKARGAGGDAENALFERIMGNLCAEIKRLDDEEIYERAMMKGSQIGLEYQAPTSDIDKIMRSMMNPSFAVSPDPMLHKADEFSQPTQPNTQMSQEHRAKPPQAATSGPWNNLGKKPASLKPSLFTQSTNSHSPSPRLASATSARSTSSAAPTTSFTSTTTAGTNATQLTPSTAKDHQQPQQLSNLDEHGLSMMSPGSPDAFSFSQRWPAASSTPMAGSSQTVVGGKRTRSGLTRR